MGWRKQSEEDQGLQSKLSRYYLLVKRILQEIKGNGIRY